MYRLKCGMNFVKVIMISILFYGFYSTLLTFYFKVPFIDNIDEIITLAGIVCIVLQSVRKGKVIIPKESVLLVLFCVSGVIGSFLSEVNTQYCVLGMFLFVKSYLLYYIFERIKWKIEDVERILKIAKVIYVIFILLGYLFYLFPSMALFDTVGMSSVCSHPAVFATLMVPVVVYCVIMIIEEGKMSLIMPLIVSFICIVLASTSKNIISIGVAILIYMLVSKKQIKYIFIIIGATIILLFLSQLLETLSIDYQMYILAEDAATRPRTMLLNGGFMIAKDYFPFGSGFGTYGSSVARDHYSSLYYTYGLAWKTGLSENSPYYLLDTYWPSVLGETGWFGTILLLSFLMSIVTKTYKNFAYVKNNKERNWGYIILLSFVALLVESLFTSTFFGMKCYLVIGLLGIYNSIMKERKMNLNSINSEQ